MSLQKVFSRYNGDFDIIQGGPTVTWAEFEIACHVEQLEKYIKALEDRIASLEGRKVEEPANTGMQSDSGYAPVFDPESGDLITPDEEGVKQCGWCGATNRESKTSCWACEGEI